MREYIDTFGSSGSLAGRLMPAARIADDVLRATIVNAGFTRFLKGGPCLLVVHGVRAVDAGTLHLAAQEFLGGTTTKPIALDASVRDWTEPERLRSNYIEHLVTEASVSTRPFVVLCRSRSQVPSVVSAIADAVLPLADRKAMVADFVRREGGFTPDDTLLARLCRLTLPHLNYVLRPGMTRERMWAVAGKLRRLHTGDERSADKVKSGKGKPIGKKRPADMAAGSGDGRPERLEDLHGVAEAQNWGLSLAADLAEYQAGTLPWNDIENGAVLHGPPGTGKTLFAKALAGSCGVPLHVHSVAAWQARGHLGDMLKAMRAAFDEARKSSPCVLFLDELDSVGSRDEPLGDHASYQRQVVNGILECLDGTVGRGGVVVVGATNNLSVIDRAILRPGRLGRLLEVRLPDLAGRVGILKHHLRDDLPDADLAGLADEIGEASGAALAQLVREARGVARRGRRPLSEADLCAVLPPGVLMSDAAFRRMCIHEAGHVVTGMEMSAVSGLVPTKVRVRRRVRDGADNRTDFDVVEGTDQSRENVEAQIVVMLAGAAAEEVLLGSRSTFAGGSRDADLVRATRLATSFEFALGLGDCLHAVPTAELASGASAQSGERSRDRVEQVLGRCFGQAKAIVERRRHDVEALALRLTETNEVRLV